MYKEIAFNLWENGVLSFESRYAAGDLSIGESTVNGAGRLIGFAGQLSPRVR